MSEPAFLTDACLADLRQAHKQMLLSVARLRNIFSIYNFDICTLFTVEIYVCNWSPFQLPLVNVKWCLITQTCLQTVQSLPWNCVLSLHLIEKGKCWIKNIKEWEGLLGLWKHRHPEEGKLAPREGLLNKSSKWLAETNDFTFLHNQLRIYTGGGSGHRPDKLEVAEEHGHEEINLCVM